ncbi:MAG: hypothetical protein ACR2RD_15530 [Woeseiaceae bacterium]
MVRKSILWKWCCGIVIALSAFAFSPVVLPPGQHTPELFGLPRSLWIGILIAFGLVAMTLIGGIVHPANDSEKDQSRNTQC